MSQFKIHTSYDFIFTEDHSLCQTPHPYKLIRQLDYESVCHSKDKIRHKIFYFTGQIIKKGKLF